MDTSGVQLLEGRTSYTRIQVSPNEKYIWSTLLLFRWGPARSAVFRLVTPLWSSACVSSRRGNGTVGWNLVQAAMLQGRRYELGHNPRQVEAILGRCKRKMGKAYR